MKKQQPRAAYEASILTHLGQCNGTRMVVIELFETHIKCIIMTGDHSGEEISVFPMANMYTNTDTTEDFPAFSRFQLPIRPAFAITINKSQGQTLKRVGIVLNSQCFAHGQLYVALSRVRSRNEIKVYVPPQFIGQCNGQQIPHATNIVFPQVLKTIQVLTVDVQTALLQPTPQQQQPYSPLSSQWPSSQQHQTFVTQPTQQATQSPSSHLLLPRIRSLTPSLQQPSTSSHPSQHPPPYSQSSILSPSPVPFISPRYISSFSSAILSIRTTSFIS